MLELDAWLEIAKSAALEGGKLSPSEPRKRTQGSNGFRSRY